MDSYPLVTEQTDDGATLVKKLRASLPVEAAFWFYPPDDDGDWSLYIVLSDIDRNNVDLAYGEVLRIAQSMNTPYLHPLQIQVIGPNHPLAQAAMALNRKYPGDRPIRSGGRSFSRIGREEMYVYPSQLVAASHP